MMRQTNDPPAKSRYYIAECSESCAGCLFSCSGQKSICVPGAQPDWLYTHTRLYPPPMLARKLLKAALLSLFVAVQLTPGSHAQSLEAPTGPVILSLTGEIELGNDQDAEQGNTERAITAQFDLAMIEKIGLVPLATETPWTNGVIDFEGVLARDLLALVKARGSSVRASALDNYSVDIPVEDFVNHDVIIATRINGKALRVRDNGPLWVIYPWSDNSKLKRPHYFARSIWQLQSLTVNK